MNTVEGPGNLYIQGCQSVLGMSGHVTFARATARLVHTCPYTLQGPMGVSTARNVPALQTGVT